MLKSSLFLLCFLSLLSSAVMAQSVSPAIRQLQKIGSKEMGNTQKISVQEGPSKSEQQLESKNPDEIVIGLGYFERKLPLTLKNKTFSEKTLNQILDFLVHPSPSVREAAVSFLEKQVDVLLKTGMINPSLMNKRAELVYKTNENLVIFLGLMHALIPHDTGKKLFGNESIFFITDGITSGNDIAVELSTDLLSDFNERLVDMKIWDDRHIQIIFNSFSIIKPEHRSALMKPLRKNILKWSELGFINAKDMQNFIVQIFKLQDDGRENYVRFLTEKNTLLVSRKTGVMTSAFLEDLLDAFEGDDQGLSLSVYEFLTPALAEFHSAQVMTKESFNRLWLELSRDPLRVYDPLALILENASLIKTQGWLSAADFMSLVKAIANGNHGAQKRLLGLIIEHQKKLNASGFLDRKWLLDWLMLDPARDDLHDEKIIYLKNNFRSLGLAASPAWIQHLLTKDILSGNPTLARAALDLLKNNTASWVKSGRLKSSSVSQLLGSLKDSRRESRDVLDWITSLPVHYPELIDSIVIEGVLRFFDAPLPEVAHAAEYFFTTHQELLETRELWPESLNKKSRKKSF